MKIYGRQKVFLSLSLSLISVSINKAHEVLSEHIHCFALHYLIFLLQFETYLKMAEKIIKTSKQSSMAEAPFDAIRVMVVDDDIICLSIVAGMLKTWKYQGSGDQKGFACLFVFPQFILRICSFSFIFSLRWRNDFYNFNLYIWSLI